MLGFGVRRRDFGWRGKRWEVCGSLFVFFFLGCFRGSCFCYFLKIFLRVVEFEYIGDEMAFFVWIRVWFLFFLKFVIIN